MPLRNAIRPASFCGDVVSCRIDAILSGDARAPRPGTAPARGGNSTCLAFTTVLIVSVVLSRRTLRRGFPGAPARLAEARPARSDIQP